MPVAMGVIAGDSDDGVVIVRCERITKEQMRSEHSRVEMTYCRSVVHCRGDSIDEISEVVGLFGGAEVFDSFDEFGLADLSKPGTAVNGKISSCDQLASTQTITRSRSLSERSRILDWLAAAKL